MLRNITITTTEAEALQLAYSRIIEFSKKSPNTAALLDIKPIVQERINQVLDRLTKTEPHDGRNIYLISGGLRSKIKGGGTDHSYSETPENTTLPGSN